MHTTEGGNAKSGMNSFLRGEGADTCPWTQDQRMGHLEWMSGYLGASLMQARSEGGDVGAASALTLDVLREREILIRQAKEVLPPMEMCERLLEISVMEWPNHRREVCEGFIAHNLTRLLSDMHGKASPSRGAYWGPVSERSVFRGASPVAHHWVSFTDGLVLDPLRWMLEAKPAFLWVGPAESYDLNAVRVKARVASSTIAEPIRAGARG